MRRSHLGGLSLLYVGGRAEPGWAICARSASNSAPDFLHHDGGIEDRSGLLAGLVSRADVVMFPVDCVSHEPSAVKRLCRRWPSPMCRCAAPA